MSVIMQKTLYGADSKGGIKVWTITVVEGESGYTVSHGKFGGKLTQKFTKTEPKNVGKANATTANSQAVCEALSKILKQKDKGYVDNINCVTPNKNPMLAHDYRKQGHRINYACPRGVYVQPKLDGVRCIATLENGVVKFMSRGGKDYLVPAHIEKDLQELFLQDPEMVLDGELYIHGVSLQEIVSCVKKHNEDTKNLEYRIFDVASDENTWNVRRKLITSFCDNYLHLKHVKFVEDTKVNNFGEVKQFHDLYVKAGYEGVMIRQGVGKYTYNFRSAFLQKYKEFDDAEFTIVGVKEDNDGLGIPICSLHDGTLFYPTLKGTHAARKELLDNKKNYIGKIATVMFQGYTIEGVPLFPRTVAIRDYE